MNVCPNVIEPPRQSQINGKKSHMKKQVLFIAAAVVGLALSGGSLRLLDTVNAAGVPPILFQAAGSTVASVQSMVDAFRAALGSTNNGNAVGPVIIDARRPDAALKIGSKSK